MPEAQRVQIQGYTNSHGAYYRTSQALKELVEKGVLELVREDTTNWRVFMESFEDKGVQAEPSKLRDLVDCKARKRATLVRYYLLLLANMSASTKTCNKEGTWFARQLGVSPNSIATYNRYLEELKIIYVHRPKGRYKSNICARYEDRGRVR